MTTMEDLTKTQIVLLTLLVSFITSIATGIITSTLLAQAPANVTQTIDRVVERTIEKVAPTPTGAGTTVREVTVIKEGDAIVSSIDQNAKAVVRIRNSSVSGDAGSEFYAMGVVVNRQGLILSDKRGIVPNASYIAVFSDGSTLPVTAYASSETGSLALFKLNTDDVHLRALSLITLSKTDPKLGQTVIAIEGVEKNAVAVGRVLSIDTNAGAVDTDIPARAETAGGPLLNLSGELIGMKTSNSDLTLPPGSYTVASALTKFVAAH
ncbi:serine protease [Candidatus Parcubacteria bacterium]|nr:serine protease [Candidatus Parcubacteria bacterium]